jgi:hypothetical protein
MTSFRIGQEVLLDLFGLEIYDRNAFQGPVVGIVVALHPGVTTIRLEPLPARPRRGDGQPASRDR